MAKKKTKRTRRRRRSRINPMLGLLGLAATAGLANKDAIGKGLGGAKEWISNLFGKKGGDLSQMPFGSDDRIAEYKKRDWAPDDTLMAPTTSAGDLSQMPFGSQERIDEYNNRGWAMDDTTMIPGGVSDEVGERYPVSDEIMPMDYSGESVEDYSGESVEVPDWNNPDSITQGDVDTFIANQEIQGNNPSTGSILAGTKEPPTSSGGGIFSKDHWIADPGTNPDDMTWDQWAAHKFGFGGGDKAPSSDLSNTFIGAPTYDMNDNTKKQSTSMDFDVPESGYMTPDSLSTGSSYEPLSDYELEMLGGGEEGMPKGYNNLLSQAFSNLNTRPSKKQNTQQNSLNRIFGRYR